MLFIFYLIFYLTLLTFVSFVLTSLVYLHFVTPLLLFFVLSFLYLFRFHTRFTHSPLILKITPLINEDLFRSFIATFCLPVAIVSHLRLPLLSSPCTLCCYSSPSHYFHLPSLFLGLVFLPCLCLSFAVCHCDKHWYYKVLRLSFVVSNAKLAACQHTVLPSGVRFSSCLSFVTQPVVILPLSVTF